VTGGLDRAARPDPAGGGHFVTTADGDGVRPVRGVWTRPMAPSAPLGRECRFVMISIAICIYNNARKLVVALESLRKP
jgi:hypothetical protein